MSHHSDAGSSGDRHDDGAERHRHHHHGSSHGSGQEHEQQHPGPQVAARATGSPQEIAGYLDDLASAIRTGGITIHAGERAVGLRLNGEVAFELRAAAGDGGASQLDLSLRWQAPRPPTPPVPALRISALQTPEPESGPGREEHAPPAGDNPTEPTESQF